ncbi:MAG TPA: flagellar basal body P-ring formation chaperone FlgA [Phycisphaerales bacterium]|nr:flagellar basal body P-ring formation chaperone FlgA [Phycisphaerales bacterium]
MSTWVLTRSASRVGWWVWPLAALAVLVGAGAAGAEGGQVSVVLKNSAVVAAGADAQGPRAIVVSDVAEVDPPTTPEGTAIGQIEVGRLDRSAGFVMISISQVRAAMDAAGVMWARTTLRGSSCRVTDGNGAMEPRPSGGPTVDPGPLSAVPQAIGGADAGTVRGAIGARLAALYGVAGEDLRVAFDSPDEAFLSQAVTSGAGDRRVDVQPSSGGASARTPVNVFIYEGDRLTQTRLVGTRALVNRTVVTARAPVTRGQAIAEEMVEVGRQWLPPNARLSVTLEEAVGQVAARPIAAGAIVTTADVTAPVVCKRGDIVWVHVLSGGMSVKAKARAMAQARDGERVQLKLDGSDRTFTARMSGPGRAVMLTDDGTDQSSIPPTSSPASDGTDAAGVGDAVGRTGADPSIRTLGGRVGSRRDR